jgi:hypothetical protein
MSIMKTSDRGNEFLSKNFEPAGKYFLVSQPPAAGNRTPADIDAAMAAIRMMSS